MDRRFITRLMVLWCVLFWIPRIAMAFSCDASSGSTTIAASTVPLTTSGTSTASSNWTTSCSGASPGGQQDAMRINSITLNPVFSNAGYDIDVSTGGTWRTRPNARYACLWPSSNTNYNCSPTVGSGTKHNMRYVSVRLKRTSAATFATIPSGTTIATIDIWQRSNGTWSNTGGWASVRLTIKLSGDLKSVVPTCDVKDYDNAVTLPTVKSADLKAIGSGRYTAVKKPFTFAMECEYSPKVNITFTGTTMPGTNDEVLANTLPGNDNVGLQLEYVNAYNGDKTVVKAGTEMNLLSVADTNETLNFNAWYYYKGGSVHGGKISAQSEFTFDYD